MFKPEDIRPKTTMVYEFEGQLFDTRREASIEALRRVLLDIGVHVLDTEELAKILYDNGEIVAPLLGVRVE
jgi:hypothetical protein